MFKINSAIEYWTTFSTEPTIPAECTTYYTLNDSSRYWSTSGASKCDNHLVSGHWYRFMGAAGVMMATYCIPQYRCNAYMSGWISGNHPSVAYDKVSGTVCMHYTSSCCYTSYSIEIRNCRYFWSTNIAGYLYSSRALFVLYEAHLDNKVTYSTM